MQTPRGEALMVVRKMVEGRAGMVMRLGQGRRGPVYTFVVGLNTGIGKHTDQRANTHTHTHTGMGMHANMCINAQMPTLNTEIAKLQPVSSLGQYHTSTQTNTHTHTHTQRRKCIHSRRRRESHQWS